MSLTEPDKATYPPLDKSDDFDFETFYAGPEAERIREESYREYARINTPFWYWLEQKIESWKEKRK